jgi:chitinase
VEALRPRLDALGRPMILSAATAPSYEAPRTPELYAGLQRHFDQVNLMTYVLSGPWEGWISWHGSPLGNGGGKFPGGRDLPSIERDMALFAKAGVAKEKLGIGLAFHGDIWTGGSGTPTGGVTAPRQLWTTPPGIERDVAYSAILAKYAASAVAGYDAVARTPYFSVDHAEDARDVFVSYCDAAAITARLEFMAREGYGGCIVWQITQDRLPDGSQPLAAALVRFRAQ